MAAIGSLDWAQINGGNLTNRERAMLMFPMLKTTVAYTVGRLRLLMGWRASAIDLDADALVLPDSQLAKLAEAECQDMLSPSLVNHSYRTFLFALALAQVDHVQVDMEHLYVTCLLHDITLEQPQAGCCFAVRSAERMQTVAQQAECPDDVVHQLAEAISMHITPGIRYHQNTLAALINYGALLDLVGMRLWDVPSGYADAVINRYPRHQLKRSISQSWRDEARTVPGGRANWIERMGLFSLFIRLAPFKDSSAADAP